MTSIKVKKVLRNICCAKTLGISHFFPNSPKVVMMAMRFRQIFYVYVTKMLRYPQWETWGMLRKRTEFSHFQRDASVTTFGRLGAKSCHARIFFFLRDIKNALFPKKKSLRNHSSIFLA